MNANEDRKDVQVRRLRQMLETGNEGGNDLIKRNYAIATLCGPPEPGGRGKQTERLLKLAVAVLEARGAAA